MHYQRPLVGDVQTHLVEQLDRSNWKTKTLHAAIDVFDRHSLIHHPPCLVEVGRENAVDPKPRMITHHDYGLSHTTTEVDRRDRHPRLRMIRNDDLQQRHFLHRRKEMHADHTTWMPSGLGDAADRYGARVGCQDTALSHQSLQLTKHLTFHIEVLENCLDHQVRPTESRPIGSTRYQGLQTPVLVLRKSSALEPVPENLAPQIHSPLDSIETRITKPHIDARPQDGGPRDGRPHEPGTHNGKALHIFHFRLRAFDTGIFF